MTRATDLAVIAASFAAMLSPDGEPLPGTPLAAALDGNPLAGQKALTDHVQQLVECDLGRANDLLEAWSTSVQMAADLGEITEED